MSITQQARQVQELYPLLYFAVHRQHSRNDGLSPSGLRILHHCAGEAETWASQLARHLGLSRSTLSESLSALEAGGWVSVSAPNARRRRIIELTERGRDAIENREGLSRDQIEVILARLTSSERTQVVGGLQLLAKAIRRDP